MNSNYKDITTGVIVVDHGSRREESNLLLNDVVDMYRHTGRFQIVEAAHMELAMPSIADAFQACVNRGANRVVVFPYFLSPGRHWHEDIPKLTKQAAELHPGIPWVVTAPIGLHELMGSIMQQRIDNCMQSANDADASPSTKSECDICQDPTRCEWQTANE